MDVLDGDRGKNYPTSDDFDISGHTIFLNASNVTNNGFLFQDNQFITEEKSNNMGNGKLEEDDIVITSRGSLGHIAWYNADISSLMPYARINSGMLILRNKKEIETEYLYHFMKSDKGQSQISFISFGSAQPQLTKKGVEDLKVILPTRRDEQTQLGHCFSSLDHLITLHQRKCEETKKLKKYMLQKMFPQNGKRVPEIRFAGFTDDWEQRKLSEIATMHARIGWQNLRTSEFLDSGDYMLITGTDFEDGTINYSTCHYVEKERYEQDKNIQIRNGSILITKDGTLGKVAYVQGLTMPATLNAGVFNVEIKDKKETDEKYLFQYLKAPFLMDYVTRHATGGTIKHLNQSILINFPVYMPKKSEQEKIGLYLMQLDSLITLHQRKYEELQKIKKFMLQNMFI